MARHAGKILAACLLAGLAALAPRLLPRPELPLSPSYSRLVCDARGDILYMSLSDDEKYRLPVTLDNISTEAVLASLLYEDKYFYRHWGINPFSLLRAFAQTYLSGGRRVGASTITMQVARLAFGLRTSTAYGKLRQMFMALRLEAHYSKREILEAYFRLAPYGANVEGIEAAARVYFHKTAAALNPAESLLLAVVPQNPSGRYPAGTPGQRAELDKARMRLRDVFLQKDMLTEQQRRFLSLPSRVYGPRRLPFKAPHAVRFLLGGDSGAGPLVTTLDMRVQNNFEGIIRRFAARGAAYGLRNAAALLVHWPGMEVRAHIGSADFSNSAIQGQVDGARAPRSPGSTLKPFIYALAVDQGLIHPMSLLADSPRSYAGYSPENFDQGFRGPLPAHVALKTSRNIPAISLALQLKHPNLYDLLQQAGANLPQPELHYGLSLVLGGAEISMYKLAELYAALANGGMWRPALLARRPRSPVSGLSPRRLFSPEAAFITLDMLGDPARSLPAKNGRLPVYLKTGTSNGFRDAWTAGIFGPYVLVVWAGNFDNSANPHLVGRRAALPLFEDLARSLNTMHDLEDHIRRQQKGLNVVQSEVCTATGDTDVRLCPETSRTWFIPGVSPIKNSGVFRAILIDRGTGLRSCAENENSELVVWEFWPSDMQRIFARAGIVKKPPPNWIPGCAGAKQRAKGSPPEITVPKSGVTYRMRLSEPKRYALPLAANCDADSKTLHWFNGAQYIGSVPAGAHLEWIPPVGVSRLRVVDDTGRASAVRLIVETVE